MKKSVNLMRLLVLFGVLFSFVGLYSCSSIFNSCGKEKKDFIDNFYNFIDEIRVEQRKGEISSSQWEGFDKKYHQLTSECYHQFEKELTTTDKLSITAGVGFYLYAKHGRGAILKIAEQDAAIRQILSEIDPLLLLKIGTEILNNPEEIRNIMGDLENRYGG